MATTPKRTFTPDNVKKEALKRLQGAAAVMLPDQEPDQGFDLLCTTLALLGLDPRKDDFLPLLEAETTTEADVKPKLVTMAGTTPIRFKAGWKILKGGTTEEAPEKDKKEDLSSELLRSLRPVDQWKDHELIDAYDMNCSSKIVAELRTQSKARRFVIFNDDGKCNKELTKKLLSIARRQPMGETWSDDSGKVHRLYQAGDFPAPLVEECPIHCDTVLADGYCDKCKENWKGVDEKLRVWVRVAVKKSYGSSLERVFSPLELANLIEKMRNGENPLAKIKVVTLAYEELESVNKLPILTKKLSQPRHGKADPFHHREF